MKKNRNLRGSALFTHTLKNLGDGKSMASGLEHITRKARNEGFQLGVNYALTKLSLWERITGRPFKRK